MLKSKRFIYWSYGVVPISLELIACDILLDGRIKNFLPSNPHVLMTYYCLISFLVCPIFMQVLYYI